MSGKILASVNGKPITEDAVSSFLAGMGQRGQAYNNAKGREAILDQLINRELLLLDAMRNLLEREPAFKEELQRVKEDMLVEYAANKVISSVRIKDDDVKAYYEQHKDQMVSGDLVDASHILVGSKEQAEQILSDIRAQKITFEDAARQYSTCPSAKAGGSLGEFGRGQMVPAFEEACFALQEGEISEPVQTEFGYHLIRLNRKQESQPVSFGDAREQLTKQLLAEKQQAAYQSKLNQLRILYPVDKY
ncbi:MAG: peptidylprolyl isomerase [Clostridia bacterium]|nr:peptidylprolyl isomerase [Clostridia bacterium]